MSKNSPYLEALMRAINAVPQDSDHQADSQNPNMQRHADAERYETEKEKDEGDFKRFPDLQEYLNSMTDNLNQDRKERKKYANLLFWVVVIWLTVVISITIVSGFDSIKFSLDESVLIALISGASIGFIGALATIVKHLFRRD